MKERENSVHFDYAREARIGLPEAVFCEDKPLSVLLRLMTDFAQKGAPPILFTRLAPESYGALPEEIQTCYNYHKLSGTAFCRTLPRREGNVALVSAGTTDGPVVWEAARTLEYLGYRYKLFEDCGVAGLWRIMENIEEINSYDVVIVVAGFEGSLPTVIGGLTSKPLFAVPSPTGYGLAHHGETALAAMLCSCAPGISVLNIGNGYGAACAAARVLHALSKG